MSPRARYALIISILAVVLLGGGFAVWYFGLRQQAGTAVPSALADTNSCIGPNGEVNVCSQGLKGFKVVPPTEVVCTSTYSGGQEYAHAPGDTFTIDYSCTNKTQKDLTYKLEQLDYDIVAWQVPPIDVANGCKDQSDIGGSPDWPDQYPYADMLGVAQRSNYDPASAGCDQLIKVPDPLNEGNQASTGSASKNIQLPAGQAVSFQSTHALPACNYHQFDDAFKELDANGQETGRWVPMIGDVARVSAGKTFSCPNAPKPTAVGDISVRIFEDLNNNKEYDDPPAGEGAVFSGHTYHIFLHNTRTEIDYAKFCDGGDNKVGGAGRDTCSGLTLGQYDVDVDPNITTPYQGPIKDPAHNPNGLDPLTVTVTGTQTVIADFGYIKPVVSAKLGNLEVRIAQDIDKNSEYSTPTAGGTDVAFAGAVVSIKDSSGNEITDSNPAKSKCTQGNATGGAGRLSCPQIPVGAYTITTTDQDPATYAGPKVDANANPKAGEQHNAAPGNTTETLTVVEAPAPTGTGDIVTYADFLYDPLVQAGLTCVASATPTSGQAPLTVAFDGSASNPGSGNTMTSYAWAFGDGQTGTGATVSHAFTTAGGFTTTLTVTNSANQTKSCTVAITVSNGGPTGSLNTITVFGFNDKNENGARDTNDCSQTEDGYNGATVTVKDSAGTVVGTKDTTARPSGPTLCNGWAFFDKLKAATYSVCIDENDRPQLDATGKTFLLKSMKRTVPAAACTNVALPTIKGSNAATVYFGYNPRPVVAALECTIDKSVTDQTPADEGTPDDPKKTNSAPGEKLSFKINWTCSGFPPTFKFMVTDTYDKLLAVVAGSITGGGVDNASQHVITWSVPNSAGLKVASGTVNFDATIKTPLAPGTYTLPNYVVMAGTDGKVMDQDQTNTTVVVPTGPAVPDIGIDKLCKDVNGGTLLPNDVLECNLVVWNNGNAPLNNVHVTDNMPPFVHGFAVVPPLPTGAVDSSQPAPAGSNRTGLLDIAGFNLTNQGDVATITFRITVDAGTPTGTQINNLATATSGTVTDTDEEDVVVGGNVPTPPTSPAPGPTAGQNPPPLGPRVAVPTTPGKTSEAGVSAQNWVLIVSAIAAALIAAFVYSRLKLKPE